MREPGGWSFAEIDGGKLCYEARGQGPPLILIHAEALDARMWDEQSPAFSERCRTVRYDRRHYGKSVSKEDFSAPASDLDSFMEQIEEEPASPAPHEDLRALLDHLEIESSYLLGMEVGGGIAIDFALTYPERVEALVLVAPSLGGRLPSEKTLERMAWVPEAWEEAVRTGDPTTFIERSLEDAIYRTATETTRRKLREMFVGNALSFLSPRGFNVPMLDPPAAERLHEIGAPTLIVVGEEDDLDSRNLSDELARGIEDSKVVIVPQASRQINMDEASKFNELVLGFLENVQKR